MGTHRTLRFRNWLCRESLISGSAACWRHTQWRGKGVIDVAPGGGDTSAVTPRTVPGDRRLPLRRYQCRVCERIGTDTRAPYCHDQPMKDLGPATIRR